MTEKSKLAKDEAKRRKELRAHCKIIIKQLEKDHERDMDRLKTLVQEAERPGSNGTRKTKTLTDCIWGRISYASPSRLNEAIGDDDFILFQSIMAIRGGSAEQKAVAKTHLCSCIGLWSDYDYAKDLLESGSDPNADGINGFTPILKLIDATSDVLGEEGCSWIADRMAMLLRHGANPSQPLGKPVHIWGVLMGTEETPITICKKILFKIQNETPKKRSLRKLIELMEAKGVEKELGDELTAKTDAVKRKPGI